MSTEYKNKSILFLSDNNERLYAMEPRLGLDGFPPLACFEPGTASLEGQLLTY